MPHRPDEPRRDAPPREDRELPLQHRPDEVSPRTVQEAPPREDREAPLQHRPDEVPTRTIQEGDTERQPEEPHGPSEAV